MQFESDARESIKIGSLKARPSNCRLRPCMTGRPRPSRPGPSPTSQVNPPPLPSHLSLSLSLSASRPETAGCQGPTGVRKCWAACCCLSWRQQAWWAPVGGWAGEQNQSQLSSSRLPPRPWRPLDSSAAETLPKTKPPPPTVAVGHFGAHPISSEILFNYQLCATFDLLPSIYYLLFVTYIYHRAL